MEKQVKCVSCGAAFNAALVRCPYCQTANEQAAEKEYMGKLEDIREGMEDEIQKTEKRVPRSLVKTVGIILAVAAVILILWFGLLHRPVQKDQERHQQKIEELLKKNGEGTEASRE